MVGILRHILLVPLMVITIPFKLLFGLWYILMLLFKDKEAQ